MYKSKRPTHLERKGTTYYGYYSFAKCHCGSEDYCICSNEKNWLDESHSHYHVEEKRIVNRISGLAQRNSYLYSACDGKDLLPLWKLTLKTSKLIELRLELAVPNCIHKSDIIDINCAILGKQYTKCTCNYITELGIKMNKLRFDFAFAFEDTWYYEQNIINCKRKIKNEYELIGNTYKSLKNYFGDQDIYDMEQMEDIKWIQCMKYNDNCNQDNTHSDQFKFSLTFGFDILRFTSDLDEKWYDFHFGDFNKLLDEIYIDNINDKNTIIPLKIDYCCKDVLTKNIEKSKSIVDILQKKYNYGSFANVFYDVLNQYLYSSNSSRKFKCRFRSRYNINNINNDSKNNKINKRNKKWMNKFMKYNFNNIEDVWANRECCQLINEPYYFDVCCTSFNNPNVLYNTWKQNQDDEYLYLLFKGQYKKCDHQWFLNSQTLYNIICLKKIVYDKYRNTGALSKYAYGRPYYFNHYHYDDEAHYDNDNNNSNGACDQESTTDITDETHCQHTGQDNPSDMYFVDRRYMDDEHVTTKVVIKNYHEKRRYYRFNHFKTECKQIRKKKKIKAKRKKGKAKK